jgi:cytochrome c peroxidase
MTRAVMATLAGLFAVALVLACADPRSRSHVQAWEADNPLRPIPKAPLGLDLDLLTLPDPPTPARVRLGRWLFFDRRLSSDHTVSCATCHQPANAFSSPAPVATGIAGHRGRRKVLPIINLAIAAPPTGFRDGPRAAFFWDGRAPSLERQVIAPIVNPDEMGNSESAMLGALSRIDGYRGYLVEAFGDARMTPERVAVAIADYERTRLSGNSPFDRWRVRHQEDAISDTAKLGFRLFNGTAQCGHCHGARSFNGGGFHNTGIGWDPGTRTFADPGRHAVTRGTVFEEWPGTFKAPTLREVSRHAPYMHDGSIATLRGVVEFYNRGANPNPNLSAFIKPLGLSPHEIDAIVDFLKTLDGEGWQDNGPVMFPQ